MSEQKEQSHPMKATIILASGVVLFCGWIIFWGFAAHWWQIFKSFLPPSIYFPVEEFFALNDHNSEWCELGKILIAGGFLVWAVRAVGRKLYLWEKTLVGMIVAVVILLLPPCLCAPWEKVYRINCISDMKNAWTELLLKYPDKLPDSFEVSTRYKHTVLYRGAGRKWDEPRFILFEDGSGHAGDLRHRFWSDGSIDHYYLWEKNPAGSPLDALDLEIKNGMLIQDYAPDSWMIVPSKNAADCLQLDFCPASDSEKRIRLALPPDVKKISFASFHFDLPSTDRTLYIRTHLLFRAEKSFLRKILDPKYKPEDIHAVTQISFSRAADGIHFSGKTSFRSISGNDIRTQSFPFQAVILPNGKIRKIIAESPDFEIKDGRLRIRYRTTSRFFKAYIDRWEDLRLPQDWQSKSHVENVRHNAKSRVENVQR